MIAILRQFSGGEQVIHLTDAAVMIPEPPLRVLDLGGTGLSPELGWITEDEGKSFRDPTIPTLPELRAIRTAALRAACAAAIVGGFQSAALGAPHDYPADEPSQRNLLASRNCPALAMLMCGDPAGAWMLLPHAAPQVEQVVADWNAHRQAQQLRLVELAARVAAAQDMDAVRAVAW